MQIFELDQKYPKINPSSMYKNQFPIFKFKNSSINKYLKHQKIDPNDIQSAVVHHIYYRWKSFDANNNVKWTILAINSLIFIFIGEDWKEPIQINPHRNQNVSKS